MKILSVAVLVAVASSTLAHAQEPPPPVYAVPMIYAIHGSSPTHVWVRCVDAENRPAECAPTAGEFTSWSVRRCTVEGCASVNAFIYPVVNGRGELQRHIRFQTVTPGTYYASWHRGNVSDPAVQLVITTVVQVGPFEVNETPLEP